MATHEDNPSMNDKTQKQPHLHIRNVEGFLFPEAIALTGNATALLKLRDQIERSLASEDSYPFEEAVYQEVNGAPFEVAVKWVRRKEEMEETVPKPERIAEELPWAEIVRRSIEEKRARE
jgi:hypothetical protein